MFYGSDCENFFFVLDLTKKDGVRFFKALKFLKSLPSTDRSPGRPKGFRPRPQGQILTFHPWDRFFLGSVFSFFLPRRRHFVKGGPFTWTAHKRSQPTKPPKKTHAAVFLQKGPCSPMHPCKPHATPCSYTFLQKFRLVCVFLRLFKRKWNCQQSRWCYSSLGNRFAESKGFKKCPLC